MAAIGILLTLERLGLPAYTTYLLCAGVALAGGLMLLKLRAWKSGC